MIFEISLKLPGKFVIFIIALMYPVLHAKIENSKTGIFVGIENYQDYYDLPELPFNYDALEPWIDNITMESHHTGVHGAHTAKLNAALHEWRKSGVQKELAMSSLLNILKNIDKVPEKWKKIIKDNGGGYTNHIFYFANLYPNSSDSSESIPSKLSQSITRSFHGFVAFKTWMTKEAISMYGSGFVWLCRVPKENYLTVYSTTNQLSPISLGLQPLLCIDVWEHAYYLKHQYKRKNYVDDWWKVINWTKVGKLHDWWLSIEPTHEEL